MSRQEASPSNGDVQRGLRDGDNVEIRQGVSAGERCDRRGVYAIRLSTLAGAFRTPSLLADRRSASDQSNSESSQPCSTISFALALLSLTGGGFGSDFWLLVPISRAGRCVSDLTAPTVVVLTRHMEPPRSQTLITFPIETAVNGASKVAASAPPPRSASPWCGPADWGMRSPPLQTVNEKLSLIQGGLPPEASQPVLAPGIDHG